MSLFLSGFFHVFLLLTFRFIRIELTRYFILTGLWYVKPPGYTPCEVLRSISRIGGETESLQPVTAFRA